LIMKQTLFLSFAIGLLALTTCKQEREAPILFQLEAEPVYAFSIAADSAVFSITCNTTWTVTVKEGDAWCRTTPTAANGNGTVTVHATANPAYLQARTAIITVSAGDFIEEITVTQAGRPCPYFDAGAIATAGQTIFVGGVPTTIAADSASGGPGLTFQWYKNGEAISGATGRSYTPPLSDADEVTVLTYTRCVKNNACDTIFMPSVGSWILTVVACPFNAGAIATAGQLVPIGGTLTTISSLQNASGSGTISYQWYKNGTAISGATAANYKPPQADANIAGRYTYTRRAKDNTCNPSFTLSAGSWVLTVSACTFNAGVIASTGQTICSGNAVNTITSTTDASEGDGNISYQWRRNGSSISSATASTYNPEAYNATMGTYTFTRWAHDGYCQTAWRQSAGSWVLTVTETKVTLVAANSAQTVVNGATITPIKYTTANASAVTVIGLPAGITYSWASNTLTISGSSTVSGAHSYTVTATGMAGCVNVYASGSIRIYSVGVDKYDCVSSNLTLGSVGFASTVTHVVSGAYGSQTWSAPVTATYCYKTSFYGGSDPFLADCRNNTEVTYGHLFSWCMVKNYSEQLCPSPWRVPTTDDFCMLDKIIQNTSSCQSSSSGALYTGSVWGALYGGYAASSSLNGTGSLGCYWSSSEPGSFIAYSLVINANSVNPSGGSLKSYGSTLRCVRD
jgi:uncharacterized protein (TIGR02145 family)